MPGYVIADVTVTDPETYAGYRALTPGTIQAFDGRFLVRGGDHEVIAGGWAPGRLVLLEFDSPARAVAWYDSPAYVEARAIRQSASTGNMVHLEGDGPRAAAAASISSSRHRAAEPTPGLIGVPAHGGRDSRQAASAAHGQRNRLGRPVRAVVGDRVRRPCTAAVAWSGSVQDQQARGGVVLVKGV